MPRDALKAANGIFASELTAAPDVVQASGRLIVVMDLILDFGIVYISTPPQKKIEHKNAKMIKEGSFGPGHELELTVIQ